MEIRKNHIQSTYDTRKKSVTRKSAVYLRKGPVKMRMILRNF